MCGGFASSPPRPCAQQPGGWSQPTARRPPQWTHGHRENATGAHRWVNVTDTPRGSELMENMTQSIGFIRGS